MPSSIYPMEVAVNATPITANTDIFSTGILVTNDSVKPGGGAVLRLTFSFTFGTSPSTVGVFNAGVFKGNLNANNTGDIITDGYYRFDIEVEAGDSINLRASESITTVNFAANHLVHFGA